MVNKYVGLALVGIVLFALTVCRADVSAMENAYVDCWTNPTREKALALEALCDSEMSRNTNSAEIAVAKTFKAISNMYIAEVDCNGIAAETAKRLCGDVVTNQMYSPSLWAKKLAVIVNFGNFPCASAETEYVQYASNNVAYAQSDVCIPPCVWHATLRFLDCSVNVSYTDVYKVYLASGLLRQSQTNDVSSLTNGLSPALLQYFR